MTGRTAGAVESEPGRDGRAAAERSGGTRYRPSPYRPAWWLPGPHAQTLAARLLRAGRGAGFRRERIETPDGDFLDLDHAWDGRAARDGGGAVGPDGPDPADRPMVVVLHGLEGCSRSGYVLRTCRELLARGMRPVAMNFRSRSGEPNRRPGSYHAGRTDDLERVLAHLGRRWPDVPLGAIGFSLGGNVLLKYLGEGGRSARIPLAAAAAVSVPYDLAASAARMEEGVGRLYTRFFLRSLRRSLAAKAARFPGALDLEAGRAARTLREFDDAVTAPVHGFRSAAHYYDESSSARYVDGIGVPTLVIHARDDPLVPAACVPRRRLAGNPWIVTLAPERGGHVGFVGGAPWRPRLWAERETARFMTAHLGGGRV